MKKILLGMLVILMIGNLAFGINEYGKDEVMLYDSTGSKHSDTNPVPVNSVVDGGAISSINRLPVEIYIDTVKVSSANKVPVTETSAAGILLAVDTLEALGITSNVHLAAILAAVDTLEALGITSNALGTTSNVHLAALVLATDTLEALGITSNTHLLAIQTSLQIIDDIGVSNALPSYIRIATQNAFVGEQKVVIGTSSTPVTLNQSGYMVIGNNEDSGGAVIRMNFSGNAATLDDVVKLNPGVYIDVAPLNGYYSTTGNLLYSISDTAGITLNIHYRKEQ